MRKVAKQQYTRISTQDCQLIINLFVQQNLCARQVSDQTGHNLSSVKAIYRVFKKEGRVARKTKRDIVHKQAHNIFVFEYDKDLSLLDSLKIESSQLLNFEKIQIQQPVPKKINQIAQKHTFHGVQSNFELMESRPERNAKEEIMFYLTASKQEIFQIQLNKIYTEIAQLKK